DRVDLSVTGDVGDELAAPAGEDVEHAGGRGELVPHIASHREVNAIHAAGVSDEHATELRLGAADNLKRVTARDLLGEGWFDAAACEHPGWLEPFVEIKTLWHPSSA
ncbi:MAG: aldehyde dehydrogenase, partial [Phycisphaerales bacterium JB037]